MKYVQFSSDAQDVVISEFGGPQDPELWSFLGIVEDDDPRYLEFVNLISPSPSAIAKQQIDQLLGAAANRIAPLQYAIDLGDSNAAEQELLVAWKLYCVELNRLPEQAGYPDDIAWPAPPA